MSKLRDTDGPFFSPFLAYVLQEPGHKIIGKTLLYTIGYFIRTFYDDIQNVKYRIPFIYCQ